MVLCWSSGLWHSSSRLKHWSRKREVSIRGKRGSYSPSFLARLLEEDEGDDSRCRYRYTIILMNVRRVLPCLRQISSSSGNARRQIAKYGRVQRRYSSTATGPAASVSSPAAPIASITSELDRLSPRFDVPAESIEILRTPAEFYGALKSKILNAKRRIYLSTLYVGKSEHELVCLVDSLPSLASID